ncbi:MAG TPA: histidine phosphatase family protein [Blastococcus sp.]|jgi:probable phosphoglycerate mutase|nr:histidine phosphatase family protein [Blastococcus sp.]
MTGELYVVRHAEAAGTEQSDPSLSESGRTQAQALGRRLAQGPVAHVLHGPRRRAADTAPLLAAELPGVPCALSPLLDDRTPVPSAGRRSEYPQERHAWFDAIPWEEQDRDGQLLSAAFHQLGQRAHEMADRGVLVVVTHAFVVGWFVREALLGPAAQWLRLVPANTGLTVVRWREDGSPVLVSFNDTGHLTS